MEGFELRFRYDWFGQGTPWRTRALKGKTPAEAADIKIEVENPWVTVIQNASKSVNRDKNQGG